MESYLAAIAAYRAEANAMAHRITAQVRAPLLPAGAGNFFRRRLSEFVGLCGLSLSLALALALASFTQSDPSWNVATDSYPNNMLGQIGSHIADILLQSLGVASAILVIALACWSWRIGCHKGLPRFWLRICVLPLALLITASFWAAFQAPSEWSLPTGLGGWLGIIGHDGLTNLATSWKLMASPYLLPAVLGILGTGALVVTLGLDIREWKGIARASAWTTRLLWHGLRWTTDPLDQKTTRQIQPSQSTPRREPRLFSSKIATNESPACKSSSAPHVSRKRKRLKTGRRIASESQPTLELSPQDKQTLPPINLLNFKNESKNPQVIGDDALQQNARLLEAVLDDFGVRGQITQVKPGPVITLYELEPARGTKTARVIGLSDDIARSMSAISVRVAVIPGRNAIGIELPNTNRETVLLREILGSTDYEQNTASLTLALGKDIAGTPVIADLGRMPHLLIAGTTGSGKSVAINTMILSLLYRLRPDQCKFIMIDPKMLELSAYDGIPHLLAPVVTNPRKAVVALKWTVREMENRYQALSKLGVRNIASYNKKLEDAAAKGQIIKRTVQTGFDSETGEPVFVDQPLELTPLPSIVVVVDEMADLMLLAGKDIENAVQRLSQMARAAGIHLLMATQRPSVDVITGTIKANFPTRVSFQVTSRIDSRTILGEQGAEQLLGAGDMLYMANGGRITRVHGPFVSDSEVDTVVNFLKQQGTPDYLEDITEEPDEISQGFGNEPLTDELYEQAVALVCRERRASTSFIQRHLQIGYNRAARMIEKMELEGIVSPASNSGKREVLREAHVAS